jgi:seryl-tRNA synthetase
MLEIALVRAQPEKIKEGLAKKNFKDIAIVDELIVIDEQRRKAQLLAEENRNKENLLAKEIGELFKQGKKDDAELKKVEATKLKEESSHLTTTLDALQLQQDELLVRLPNMPHSSVPAGITPEDNEVVKTHGTIPTLPDTALAHWDLAKKYQLFDLELGVKITGAGFPVYTGQGARLQRALINFFLDRATAAGYTETMVPHMVNKASAFGTGQIPDKEGQMYYVTEDDLYLIPTAEVPVTNIFRDDIIEEKDLPRRYTAYTPCFRREAGSYGKDVRGLNRLHQFDKVEIVQVVHPDQSYAALEDMLVHVEGLLQALELPYRILRLCGGDMTFSSALTYDLEVYSAAQKRWLEVSSVSNFETFQTNRMKVRMRDENKKVRLAHSLNGSALALPRIVASMLENHQTATGIRIPAALVPYTGFDQII